MCKGETNRKRNNGAYAWESKRKKPPSATVADFFAIKIKFQLSLINFGIVVNCRLQRNSTIRQSQQIQSEVQKQNRFASAAASAVAQQQQHQKLKSKGKSKVKEGKTKGSERILLLSAYLFGLVSVRVCPFLCACICAKKRQQEKAVGICCCRYRSRCRLRCCYFDFFLGPGEEFV